MEDNSLVHANYRLVIRTPGTSRVRQVLRSGPGAVQIRSGLFTRGTAILEVEVTSRAEDLPRIESALAVQGDMARTRQA